MDTLPKVSIIIPVYNGSNFLHQAVDCALAQTYPNVEVIIVNDGSNDKGKTEAIAKSYGDKIRYYSKNNGGTASALNFGIKQMKGEWFVWLSHDDRISPNRITEDIKIINLNPNIKVIFCNLFRINEKNEIIRKKIYNSKLISNPRELTNIGGLQMCSMTIHKSCFDRVGFFNERNKTTQDVEMTLRLSIKYIFYLNNNAITYERDHQKRGTYSLSEQHKKDLLYLCDLIQNEMGINAFFPELKGNLINESDAWIWMGNLYKNYGADIYADECYDLALKVQSQPLKKILIKGKIITIKKIKPMILKLIQ